MNDLSNKIALITGATSGIGTASAKRFAEAGAVVLVGGRNADRGLAVVREIQSKDGCAEFFDLDISSDESIKSCTGRIAQKYGHLDIVFNNAGVFPVLPPLTELSRSEACNVLNVNSASLLMMVKHTFPLLKKGGCILNTASVAGLDEYTAGSSYAYCASKSAIVKITKLLAKKYGEIIRVNAIAPGVIRTPIFKNLDEHKCSACIPMRRIGAPDEVAAVANFLVSDDASFVNGAIVTVDGGQSL